MSIVFQSIALIAQVLTLFYVTRLLRLVGRPKSGPFISIAVGLLAVRSLLAISFNQGGTDADARLLFGELALSAASCCLAVGASLLRAFARRKALARLDPNESTSLTAGPPRETPTRVDDLESADVSTEPLLVCNADMEIVEANQSVCRLLGRERNDLYGKSVANLVRKEEMLLVPELFRLARAGEKQGGEWTFRRPDDSLVPVRIATRCRFKDSIRLTLTDITEERAAQKVTVNTESDTSIVEQLLDASPDGYVAYDPELKIVAWNSAMERLTGIPRMQCLNQHLLMHFPIPDELAENDFFLEALEGHSHELAGATLINPGTGEADIVDHHFAPLKNAAGEIIGGMVVVRETRQIVVAPEAASEAPPAPPLEEEDAVDTVEDELQTIPFGANLADDENLQEVSLADFLGGAEEAPPEEEVVAPLPTVSAEQVLVEAAFAAAPHIIAVYDLVAGQTVYSNRSLPESIGFSEAQIAEMGDDYLAEIVHPEDQPNLPRTTEDWNDGSGIELRVTEFRVTDPQFNWRWFQSADRVLNRDEEGNILRIVSVIEDISDRKETERGLRLGEQKYRTFSEHCPTGIWHLTAGGTTHYVNPAMCRILGVEKPGELEERTWHEFITEESRQRLVNEPGSDNDGAASTWPVEILQTDGSSRQCLLHGAPDFDESGELRGLMASIVDVTEHTAVERTLKENLAKLDERETQVTEQGARIQTLESELGSTESKLRETEDALLDRDGRLEELAARLHECEQAGRRATELEGQLEETGNRLRELQHRFDNGQAELTDTRSQLAERDERISNLSNRLQAAEQELSESHSQLELHEVRVGENDAHVQQLEQELNSCRSRLADTDAKQQEHAREIAERDDRIGELETRARDAESRFNESASHQSELESQLGDRQNRLQESEAQLTEQNRRVEDLEGQLTEVRSRLQDTEARLADRNSHIGEIEHQLGERAGRINDLEGRLSELENRQLETRTQLAERIARVEQLELQAVEKDTRINEIQHQLSDRDTRINTLQSETAALTVQITELANSREEANSIVQQRDAQIQNLETQIRESTSQLDQLHDCVWTLDGELRCDFVNRAWRERTGGAEGEDLGDRWRDRLFGQDRDRVLRAVRSAADRREPVSFDCRLSAGAGSFRWTRCHVRPRTSPAGDFLGLIASAADIHEHMLTEQDLRTTLRWHEWAQKSARLGSWEYHPKDDTGFWNDTSLELLRLNGRPSPERLHDFLSQIHPDDRAKLTAAHQQVLKSGQALAQLVFRTHPDLGPVRRLCVAVHRAPEEDGSAYFLVGTLLDVTALQSAAAPVPARAVEPAVAARADDRYRKIVEIAGQGVWMMDAEGYTSFVNPAMIRLLGRKYREFVGRHFFEFLASESTTEAEAFLERRAEGISEQTRFRLLHRAGHHVNALFTTTPLKDDDGEIIGCLCMVTDLTALHEEELSHSETESRSRALLDQAPGCILTVDRKKIIRSASRALPGVPVRQLVGTPLLNWASPADRDGYDEALDRVFDTGNEAALEFRGLGPDEETVRYAARIAPVHQGGEVVSLCVLTQILGDTADAGAADFPRQLLAAQENERRLLAAELHDHFGQSLSATKLNLEALPDDLDPAARQHVDDSLRSVTALIDRTHTLGDRLRPAILDDLGLEPALRWLVSQRADSAGFSASFNADKLPRLAPEIEANAFRIVEAALDNIAQHAHAKNVTVEMNESSGKVALTVRDDGKGFKPDKLTPVKRQGLTAMHQRAELLCGSFSLASEAGKGTTIVASLPLLKAKAKSKSARRKK